MAVLSRPLSASAEVGFATCQHVDFRSLIAISGAIPHGITGILSRYSWRALFTGKSILPLTFRKHCGISDPPANDENER